MNEFLTPDMVCPVCGKALVPSMGTSLSATDGWTIYCGNASCKAQEVSGHGKDLQNAFRVVKLKFQRGAKDDRIVDDEQEAVVEKMTALLPEKKRGRPPAAKLAPELPPAQNNPPPEKKKNNKTWNRIFGTN